MHGAPRRIRPLGDGLPGRLVHPERDFSLELPVHPDEDGVVTRPPEGEVGESDHVVHGDGPSGSGATGRERAIDVEQRVAIGPRQLDPDPMLRIQLRRLGLQAYDQLHRWESGRELSCEDPVEDPHHVELAVTRHVRVVSQDRERDRHCRSW
jgi:hypothetical protein